MIFIYMSFIVHFRALEEKIMNDYQFFSFEFNKAIICLQIQ